jgi:hypothetical protein
MSNLSATDALQLTGSPGDAGGAFVSAPGSLGGECFRATCHATGADWHHRTADRYYCADCAADINLACQLKGEPAVCRKRR